MQTILIKRWVPIVITTTIILLACYAGIQQDIRQAANDPQIQLAEDGAVFLARGVPAASLVGSAPVDVSKSLQNFGIVYDESGKITASSALLGSTTPTIPAGVFAYARTHADDRLTWQPAPGVRIAAVVKHYSGVSSSTSGFLLVGRSMREVEVRESSIAHMMLLAWFVCIIGTLIWCVVDKKYLGSCNCEGKCECEGCECKK